MSEQALAALLGVLLVFYLAVAVSAWLMVRSLRAFVVARGLLCAPEVDRLLSTMRACIIFGVVCGGWGIREAANGSWWILAPGIALWLSLGDTSSALLQLRNARRELRAKGANW